jgi:hypothetical protein
LEKFKLDFSVILNSLAAAALFAFAMWLFSLLVPNLATAVVLPLWLAATLAIAPVLVAVAGMASISILARLFVAERDDLRRQLDKCRDELPTTSGESLYPRD